MIGYDNVMLSQVNKWDGKCRHVKHNEKYWDEDSQQQLWFCRASGPISPFSLEQFCRFVFWGQTTCAFKLPQKKGAIDYPDQRGQSILINSNTILIIVWLSDPKKKTQKRSAISHHPKKSHPTIFCWNVRQIGKIWPRRRWRLWPSRGRMREIQETGRVSSAKRCSFLVTRLLFFRCTMFSLVDLFPKKITICQHQRT